MGDNRDVTTRPNAACQDIAIIGGGIIGLACAHRLAQRGASVVLIERDRIAAHASGAGAGMLAPLVESLEHADSPRHAAFAAACRASRDLWAQLAPALEQETGMDIDYDRSGALILDRHGDIERLEAMARRLGEPARRLDRQQSLELVPDLAPAITGSLHLAAEHRVDNHKACQALAASVDGLGVSVLEVTRVTEISTAKPSGARITTTKGTIGCGQILITAGAWSGAIPGMPPLPIRPMRGQIIAWDGIDWPFTGSIRGRDLYAVRRQGGRLLVGATVEDVGFDDSATADGIAHLRSWAIRTFPALADQPITDSWAGLRPTAADHLPVLGAVDDRLWIAAGHHRNGVLLAPWTAEVIAAAMCDGETTEIERFSPRRFASTLHLAEGPRLLY